MKVSANPAKTKILFLLEEQSAEEMLRQFMPRHFPGVSCTYRRFSGKGELLKRLEKVIRNHGDAEYGLLATSWKAGIWPSLRWLQAILECRNLSDDKIAIPIRTTWTNRRKFWNGSLEKITRR